MTFLFVWDFHGVLETGNEHAVLEVSNNVLEFLGYKKRFIIDDIHKLYGKKWWEYFEYLLPDEPREKHLGIQDICFSDRFNDPAIIAKHIRASENSHQVLEKILKAGHSQILISNTTEKGLKIFLESTKMSGLFPDGVFAACGHSALGNPKKAVLEKFLENRHFEKIVIVGDSPEDMKLSEVAGGVRYLYSASGNFRDCESDYKITGLKKVLEEI